MVSTRSAVLSVLLAAVVAGAAVGCCHDRTDSFGVARWASVSNPSTTPHLDNEGGTVLAHFREDGRRVLLGVSTSNGMDLWVTDRSGAVVDSIDWPNRSLQPLNTHPQFSPADPSHILFSTSIRPDSTDRYSDITTLYRYDLDTDSILALTDLADGSEARFASYFSDGENILFLYRPPEGPPELRRTDAQPSDTSAFVARLPSVRWSEAPFDVHPNGASVVYVADSRLVQKTLGSGRTTVLYEGNNSSTLRAPRFSPDGSHVLFRSPTRGRGEVLIRLRVSDGATTVVDRATPEPASDDENARNRFYSATFVRGSDAVVYGQTRRSGGGENRAARVYIQSIGDGAQPTPVAEGLGLTDLAQYARAGSDVVPTGQQIAASPSDDSFVFVGRDSRTRCTPTTF